LKEIRN